jgi:hypothetical protein
VLLSTSLFATAAGGLYLATMPDALGLAVLYGYWGVTTILLFWAALIRSTREWGGMLAQGRAFGLLDGGRGLVAAGLASLAVLLMGLLTDDPAAPDATRTDAMRAVILFYTAATAAAGGLCWVLLPSRVPVREAPAGETATSVGAVLRSRVIWLQAVVVAAAYCGYKGLDYYTLLAHERLGLSELGAARFVAAAAYLRPLAAIGLGFIADRVGAVRTIIALFAAGGASYLLVAGSTGLQSAYVLVYASVLIGIAVVYALRGVYFALLGATSVPLQHTGAAVGLVSVVGYTPDVFFAPIAGRLIDATPGSGGFRDLFLLLAAIFAVGLAAAAGLRRYGR